MKRGGAEVPIDVRILSGIIPFTLLTDDRLTVTWSSEAILRRVEAAVGGNAPEFLEFRDTPAALSRESITKRTGTLCKLALLSRNTRIPLTGHWLPAGGGFVMLAMPDTETGEDLDLFSLNDFPTKDYFVDLLVAREENTQSLQEAFSAINALKKTCRELEESQRTVYSTEAANEKLEVEISERKQAEKKLKEAYEQLRTTQTQLFQSEKMAAVGQLAAGMAHEMNNPLGIILGFAQSAAKKIKGDDPLALPLKTIEREAVRCKNLVQDLLVFSRISKGAQPEALDLNAAVESALSMLSAQTKMRNIELTRELGADLPQIHANKTQVQQIIVNLANNAIDAMPKGGTLTIRTALSGKRPGYVEIQVRDTGRGIPQEIQKKIFEPFFTTKEVGKGMGLGLSLIYEIVMKHGGTIELESEEGKGSQFTVFLPTQKGTL